MNRRDQQSSILVTRELSQDEIALAERLGLTPRVLPAIRISFPDSVPRGLEESLVSRPAIWIFTSRNGVEGVSRLTSAYGGLKPPDLIYAVGKKTANALQELGWPSVTPEKQHAIGLAERMISDLNERYGDVKDLLLVHWCGNRSRKELEEQLTAAGYKLTKRVVYETYLNELALPELDVDAVLFYSPSAVEAFRGSGGFRQDLPDLFAIGPTTAEALSMESSSTVYVPPEPSTESMLKLVAKHLNQKKRTADFD